MNKSFKNDKSIINKSTVKQKLVKAVNVIKAANRFLAVTDSHDNTNQINENLKNKNNISIKINTKNTKDYMDSSNIMN